MAQLTIYKASAGSGKTFQLTRQYLLLIFKPGLRFQSILAVTFTNKATAEMRERILSELYKLANEQPSAHAEILKKEYQLSDADLRQRAAFLLRNIVHNYSRFNISTIDSFFQIILKAFAHEIGLHSSLNIELNQRQVIEASIEDFFNKIDEKPRIKEWLSEFARQKIQDGKSWDVQKDMVKFVSEAFDETFFSLPESELEHLTSLETFNDFKKKLLQILEPFVKDLQQFGKQAMAHMQQHGLSVDDFQYKDGGVAGYLSKLQKASMYDIPEPKKRAMDAVRSTDGLEFWCAKKAANASQVQQCVQSGLQDILNRSVDLYQNQGRMYFSALEVYKNLDVFALVVELFNHLRVYSEEHDIFLLSMASPFLAKLIGNDDAPFIYEKTGEFLKYFMIDEFQDTSRMQWQNFYPLFVNSLAEGKRSLVVGDVKQSIYRWRNSDWNLLHSELLKEFAGYKPEVENLPFNFRSSKEVVTFNNWCFSSIAGMAQQQFNQKLAESQETLENTGVIEQIYESVAQEIPDNNKDFRGYVSVQFNDLPRDKELANQLVMEQLIDNLNSLFEKGYQPRDIAVLVRRNVEGALVAKHLMEYRQAHPEKEALFTFVSNDSVFLKSSVIVNYLVSALNYLYDGKNEVNKALLAFYALSEHKDAQEAVFNLASLDFAKNELFEKALPGEFVKVIPELKQMPLVQLVNRLLHLLIYSSDAHQVERNLAFIHTFQDVVLQFTQTHGDNLPGFLEWWDESGSQTAVNLSEEQNAIRILTIHKSKGLEYKAVLLPFVDWNLDQKPKLIWEQSTLEPFNTLPRFPISYTSRLQNTIFASHYLQEFLLAVVDNLNTLYVAFTRAAQALFIQAPMPSKLDQFKTVNALLYGLIASDKQELLVDSVWDENENHFTFGSLIQQEEQFLQDQKEPVKIPVPNKTDFLKLRLKSSEMFQTDEENWHTLVNTGQLYHSLLEHIFTPADVDKSINKLIGEGLIRSDEKENFKQQISRLIAAPQAAPYFTKKYQVLTEASYVLPDGTVKRPDRVLIAENEVVVVDYKYSEHPVKAHQNQVREYMNAISVMEEKSVKGFVWYLKNNEWLEVHPI